MLKIILFIFCFLLNIAFVFSENIKLAFIYSDRNVYTSSSLNALKLRAKEINESGGINGITVEIVPLNILDISDKKKAFTFLLEQYKIKVFISSNFSDDELFNFVEKNKIPLLTLSYLKKQNNYIYNMTFSKDDTAFLAADFAMEKLNSYNAVILKNIKEEDNLAANKFKTKFEYLGGNIVDEIVCDFSNNDFGKYWGYVKKLNPKIVFIPSNMNLKELINTAEKQGLKNNFITENYFDIKLTAKNINLYGISFEENSSEKTIEFIDRYKRQYAVLPKKSAFIAYEAMMILEKAMESNKKMEELNLKFELDNIKDFDGLYGNINCFKNGEILRDGFVMKLNNDEFEFYSKQSPIIVKPIDKKEIFNNYRNIKFYSDYNNLKNVYGEKIVEKEDPDFKVYSVKEPSDNVSFIDFYFLNNKLWKAKTSYYDLKERYKEIVVRKFTEKYGIPLIKIENEIQIYTWIYQQYKVQLNIYINEDEAFAEFLDTSID